MSGLFCATLAGDIAMVKTLVRHRADPTLHTFYR